MRGRIAIVGGGVASISFCYQLMKLLKRRSVEDIEVLIFEKENSMGVGLPYKEKENCYILNLPVDMMGLGDIDGETFSSKGIFKR